MIGLSKKLTPDGINRFLLFKISEGLDNTLAPKDNLYSKLENKWGKIFINKMKAGIKCNQSVLDNL